MNLTAHRFGREVNYKVCTVAFLVLSWARAAGSTVSRRAVPPSAALKVRYSLVEPASDRFVPGEVWVTTSDAAHQ